MDRLPERKLWLPSLDFLVFLVVGLIISAIAIPGLRSSQRASNERSASTALKTITSAEADFRANDRDGNHVQDFWTGDVSGLYYIQSPESPVEVQLIEPTLAQADFKPLFVLPIGTVKRSGYLYQALVRREGVAGRDGEYRVDTDKSGRKVHHEAQFGFCAFATDQSDGNYAFFVNENNTIFRKEGIGPRDGFPFEEPLKKSWGPLD